MLSPFNSICFREFSLPSCVWYSRHDRAAAPSVAPSPSHHIARHQHGVRKEERLWNPLEFFTSILGSPVTATCLHACFICTPIMKPNALRTICRGKYWGENLCVHSNFLSSSSATLPCCHGDVVTHVCWREICVDTGMFCLIIAWRQVTAETKMSPTKWLCVEYFDTCFSWIWNAAHASLTWITANITLKNKTQCDHSVWAVYLYGHPVLHDILSCQEWENNSS